MPVEILTQDITNIKTDAIVNSLGIDIDVTGIICRSIYKKSHTDEMENIIRSHSPVTAGDIIITQGYDLPCNNVIHVILPYAHQDHKYLKYEKTLRDILLTAKKEGYKSIAFPLIGTGYNGYKKEKVLDIMQNMFSSFMYIYPDINVVICINNSKYSPYLNERNRFEFSKTHQKNFLINYPSEKNINIHIYNKYYFEKNEDYILYSIEQPHKREKIDMSDFKADCFHSYIEEYIRRRFSDINFDIFYEEAIERILTYIGINSTRHNALVQFNIWKEKEKDEMINGSLETITKYTIPDKRSIIIVSFAIRMNGDELIDLLTYYGHKINTEYYSPDKLIIDILNKSIFSTISVNNILIKNYFPPLFY